MITGEMIEAIIVDRTQRGENDLALQLAFELRQMRIYLRRALRKLGSARAGRDKAQRAVAVMARNAGHIAAGVTQFRDDARARAEAFKEIERKTAEIEAKLLALQIAGAIAPPAIIGGREVERIDVIDAADIEPLAAEGAE